MQRKTTNPTPTGVKNPVSSSPAQAVGEKTTPPAKAAPKAVKPTKPETTPWLAPWPLCAQAKPLASIRVNKQTTATVKFIKPHKGLADRRGRYCLYYDGLSLLDCALVAGLDALQLAFYVERGYAVMTNLSDADHEKVVKAVADGSYKPAQRNGYKSKWADDAPEKYKALGQNPGSWLKG